MSMLPLPDGLFTLPAGGVEVSENGRLWSTGCGVAAVGVSPELFFVLQHSLPYEYPRALLEQVAGCLAGRGATVFRVRSRFPTKRHQPWQLERTACVWLNHYLKRDCQQRLDLTLSLDVLRHFCVPWEGVSERMLAVWEEVRRVADAFAEQFPDSAKYLRRRLWRLSEKWEGNWNQTVALASQTNELTAEDWAAINRVDRVWSSLVRVYLEPFGYRRTAESVARLL